MASPAEPTPPDVLIVGAGPAGCLLALLLASPSRRIHLYDYRSDPRPSPLSADSESRRSINLALSTRGLTALAQASLLDAVLAAAVPMHGRCIHPQNENAGLQFHRYGLQGQFLLSVSRERLNRILVEACAMTEGIELVFGMRCVDVDLDIPQVRFETVDGMEAKEVKARLVVGADGAFSRVRSAMMRRGRFQYSQSFVETMYKELRMQGGQSAFPMEWLHIWPRHRFMLIALPNEGGEFTCTLFMDKDEINQMNTPNKIRAFFQQNFPDAVKFMPTLVKDFDFSPTSSLLTVRCEPYNHDDKVVLIGDAAHAIVPFYGQGCNAAFEDCRLLAQTIRKHGWDDMPLALTEYSQQRKKDADAIADLALDHYSDMSSRSAKPFFVFRRRLEIMLNRFFPKSFLPLYTMISFTNIPYAEAVQKALQQDRGMSKVLRFLGIASLSVVTLLASREVWTRHRVRILMLLLQDTDSQKLKLTT